MREAGERKKKEIIKDKPNIIYILYLSYNVQPKVVVHCSCGAKLFSFDSTNVALFLYFVVLKSYIAF